LWCYCCCHLVLFCDGNKEGPVGSLGRFQERGCRMSLCWCSLLTWSFLGINTGMNNGIKFQYQSGMSWGNIPVLYQYQSGRYLR
jgi:hypothetical protein